MSITFLRNIYKFFFLIYNIDFGQDTEQKGTYTMKQTYERTLTACYTGYV